MTSPAQNLTRHSLILIILAGAIYQFTFLGIALFEARNEVTVLLRCSLTLLAAVGVILKLPVESKSTATYPWLMVLIITGLFPLLPFPTPMGITSLILGFFCIAALKCTRRSFAQFNPILLFLLISLSYPLEGSYSPLIDPYLQFSTTFYAAPLVTWTGFPVEIADIGGPLLYGNELTVHVTPLCAGLQPFTNLVVLGIILALFFLEGRFEQLLFCLLTPVVGFIMNTLRIVISTHAANKLIGNGGNWDLAHDVIGYTSFLITYLCLFLIARKLQPKAILNS